MRMLRIVGVIAAGAVVCSCGNAKPSPDLAAENAQLRAQVAALSDQLDNARTAAETVDLSVNEVRANADELAAHVARLSDEDWADVVVDLEGSSAAADGAASGLEMSTAELKSALDE